MKSAIAAVFFGLTTLAPLTAAAQNVTPDCVSAGPGADFCTQAQYNRVDQGQTEGISYWLDAQGYLAKVVVQPGPTRPAESAVIESRILSMVSQQANHVGRAFEFSDLSSARAGGARFGTISYALADKTGRGQPVLHSYLAVEGVIVQVISQPAVNGAPRDAEALTLAHHRALEAIELTNRDPAA